MTNNLDSEWYFQTFLFISFFVLRCEYSKNSFDWICKLCKLEWTCLFFAPSSTVFPPPACNIPFPRRIHRVNSYILPDTYFKTSFWSTKRRMTRGKLIRTICGDFDKIVMVLAELCFAFSTQLRRIIHLIYLRFIEQ